MYTQHTHKSPSLPRLQEKLPIILASQSESRASMLRNAGVAFSIQPSNIDEDVIKTRVHGEGGTAEKAAQELAIAKAMKISPDFSDSFVVGADQIMVCEGRWFDKAKDIEEAKQQLNFLRGKTHELVTAVCVIKNGIVVWQALSLPKMTMRGYSDAFIDEYTDKLGDKILKSVGCYQLEGVGVQLFSKIEGDMFTIMGLPMVELLNFLREANTIDV